MEEAGAGPSPVLLVVQKRLRAAKKKLTRIQELEALQASGKELNSEQIPTVKSKPAVQAIIDELQKVEEGIRDAIKEEQAAAFARGVAQAEAKAEANASAAAADAQCQLDELSESHASALAEAETQHRHELEEQRERLQAEAEAAKQEAASKAAVEAVEDVAKMELSSTHPLKSLATEPVRKLLTLMYFSQLFDIHRNPWVAPAEVFACLQYDAQAERPEGQAALSDVALRELAYFGRTLVDRMTNQVSHHQFLSSALETALAWVLQPDTVAIPTPPAPAPVTMGELQGRISRVLTSQFSQVVPGSTGDAATAAALPPPPAPISTAPFVPMPASFPVAPPPLPAPTAASQPDSYPIIQPNTQAPARAAPGPAITPTYASMQLLPSFLEDGGDTDSTTTTTTAAPLNQGGSAAAAAGHDNAASYTMPSQSMPPAAPSQNMAAGMWVLSEAGIPELRSIPVSANKPGTQGGLSDSLTDMLRSKANPSPAPTQAPQQRVAAHTQAHVPLSGGAVVDAPAAPTQSGNSSSSYNNGGQQSSGRAPGVKQQGGPPPRAWGRGQGRGGRGPQE